MLAWLSLLWVLVMAVTVGYVIYAIIKYDWSNFEQDRKDLDDNMF